MTKLYVATPSHDVQVHVAHHFSIVRLWANPPCELAVPSPDSIYDGDLVRVRSRMVADFLESNSTHLLFVDSDIDFTVECVEGMLAAGAEYVAAPYRRKLPERVELTVGIGMTLLARPLLRRMTEKFRPTLERVDYPHPGVRRMTVMLFLLEDDGALIYSEDFSFMRRAQSVGAEPLAYTGPGSPVGHWGSYRYGVTGAAPE